MNWFAEKSGKNLRVTPPKSDTIRFSLLYSRFEGHKRIMQNGVFSFEPTGNNLELFVAGFPEAKGCLEPFLLPEPQLQIACGAEIEFRMQPSEWQLEFYEKSKGRNCFALFAEPGAGKTKAGIDTAFMLYAQGEIDAVIIIAKKKIHQQWILDAMPEHAPDGFAWHAQCHDLKTETRYKQGCLNFFSINFDALNSPRNKQLLRDFINSARSILVIADESHEIKNKTSQRWQASYEIRKKCRYAMILSGTPISKNLIDYWAQYYFLDERIIGDKYITTFKSKYCVMDPKEGKFIVGYKNQIDLYKKTEPFTYRVSKTDLKMPPKRFKQIAFDMGPKQRKVYDQFKSQFLADIDSGKISSAANAGSALLRLQQITNGYLPMDDGSIEYFENPRLDALAIALEQLPEEKVIIWCRFHHDVQSVLALLGEKSVHYYGKTDDRQRTVNKRRFIEDSSVQYMVSTAAAGGVGIDGYQKVCSSNIYYSNSFNAIHRWQSEDRTNRTGLVFESTLYIDLICRSGIDRKLLANLRGKRDLSSFMLDEIRSFVENEN